MSLSTNIKYYNFHLGYDIAMHSYKSKYEDIINIDANVTNLYILIICNKIRDEPFDIQ